jgi:deazaflavin-dependent oxidoreductase (nitroreductase family)
MTTSSQRVRRWVERHLSNPLMRLVLMAGVAPRGYALIETVGRRTGRRRRTPVGNGLDGEIFWLVSEHGNRSAYVKNLTADPHVRVKVGKRWHIGTATPLPRDDAWARRAELARRNGLSGWIDWRIFRGSATKPMTIRIDLDP